MSGIKRVSSKGGTNMRKFGLAGLPHVGATPFRMHLPVPVVI